MTHSAPFGSWHSPIPASTLTDTTVGLSEPRFDGDTLYWLESRPEEKGRTTIVRLRPGPNSKPETLLPYPINVRSKVNEYGGGSYCVHEGVIYFVLADDQRVYRLDCSASTAGKIDPQPLTPDGPWRYADLVVDSARQRLLAVCEDHSDQSAEPDTTVVGISIPTISPLNTISPVDTVSPVDNEEPIAQPEVLLQGMNFYSSLDLSADSRQLCWLSWNHPDMPWDNCECWVAMLDQNGQLQHKRKIAGNGAESIFQPRWSNDGSLYYVSDRDNWWNIYRHAVQDSDLGPAAVVLKKAVEFASPQWVFGLSTYDFVDDNTLLCCYTETGRWQLAIIDVISGSMTTLPTSLSDPGLSDIAYVRCNRSDHPQAVFVGASPHHLPNMYRFDVHAVTSPTQDALQSMQVVAVSSPTIWDDSFISSPQAIKFPTPASVPLTNSPITNPQQHAYAFFYPPKNANFQGPVGELPPLIVLCHGGPTAATHSSLNIKIQYWTSRGFAVVDINYRGSTGYGRDYRQQLNQQWGVADVEDAAAAVMYLAKNKLIDANKVAIKGGSAGGYTVLAALAFTDVFKAGASYYGIGDLETLARDTHKFESRYLDTLVGPYPEQKALYQQRSPINSVEKLSCPVIFFQGLEDKVVPPNQARTMVKALDEKNIPVAYVEFAEEGHGFRQAANIQRAIEAELYFYSKVFGFDLADNIEPVEIKNLARETADERR